MIKDRLGIELMLKLMAQLEFFLLNHQNGVLGLILLSPKKLKKQIKNFTLFATDFSAKIISLNNLSKLLAFSTPEKTILESYTSKKLN